MSDEAFRQNRLIPGTNYRYLEMLGQGGQGIVVLAADDFLQTEVVIKLVHASHAEFLATRIREEARTLARINHPCIVRVIGGGMTAEPVPRPYFVMQRLQGDTLYAVMRRRAKPFAMRSAIDIAIELLEGLDVAHNPPHSLLHRDIKPANIFMSRVSPHETRAVLLDFGLAHMFEQASRVTGKIFLGTLEYASPEQLLGKPLTPRSDLYNIGLVLFELLAGRHVFAYCKNDRNAYAGAHIHDAPVRLSSLGIDMDPALDQIVHSALQKDPASRPKSAHEFAHVLKAIRTSLDVARPRPMHDAATEEEPFETLWAHMGVTPTTSGADAAPPSPLARPSSRPTVSAPVRGKSTEQLPRFETREEPARRAAFGTAPRPAGVTAPMATEELSEAFAARQAMKRFRAADTEPMLPPDMRHEDVSNPPLVVGRAQRLVRRLPASVIGVSLGVPLALVTLLVIHAYWPPSHQAAGIASPQPTALLSSAPAIATPLAPPTAPSMTATVTATATVTTPMVAESAQPMPRPVAVEHVASPAHTASIAVAPAPPPSASLPPPPGMDLLPSFDPPTSASATPKRPGSGLNDARPAATRDKSGLFTHP